MHGAVGLAQLRDEVVLDPRIVRLMSVVQIHTTEEFEPGWRDAAPFDQIFVHLDDGRRLASPKVRRATGHADTPLPAPSRPEYSTPTPAPPLPLLPPLPPPPPPSGGDVGDAA